VRAALIPNLRFAAAGLVLCALAGCSRPAAGSDPYTLSLTVSGLARGQTMRVAPQGGTLVIAIECGRHGVRLPAKEILHPWRSKCGGGVLNLYSVGMG